MNLAPLQQTFQIAEPLPHNLSPEADENQMAGTNPWHRGPLPRQHSHYTYSLREGTGKMAGHVLRMNDQRIPMVPLYSELVEGRRNVGRPKLRFNDSPKTTVKSLEIPVEGWEELGLNRPSWRSLISIGVFQVNSVAEPGLKANRQRGNVSC